MQKPVFIYLLFFNAVVDQYLMVLRQSFTAKQKTETLKMVEKRFLVQDLKVREFVEVIHLGSIQARNQYLGRIATLSPQGK